MKIDKNTKVCLFLSHIVPGIIRPMRVLWNEVIGFVFLLLGVVFTSSAVRQYRALPSDELSPVKLALLFIMPALMLYFGITSFLRARRISRS